MSANTEQKVLVLDDDKKLTEQLTSYLAGYGFETMAINDPLDLNKTITQFSPNALILDVMMPNKDGFTVLNELRRSSSLPVIMLTARGDVTDRVVGLEMGADDYLPKPFDPRELLARLKTVLRRKPQDLIESRSFGALTVNPKNMSASYDGQDLELTTMEYQLLELMTRTIDKVWSRDDIMNELQGVDAEFYSRSIDVAVSRLRNKLKKVSPDHEWVQTVWGRGYRLSVPSEKISE